MAAIAARELRNNTRAVLDRVAAGEEITITFDGRPVAVMRPVDWRPWSISREEFIRKFANNQADPGLTRELAEMMPDTTDDIPWR